MPRWAIWALNIVVIAVLATMAYFLKWAGTEFAVGALFGMCVNYVLYRNWRQDYADEAKAHFTDLSEAERRQPLPQHSHDQRQAPR